MAQDMTGRRLAAYRRFSQCLTEPVDGHLPLAEHQPELGNSETLDALAAMSPLCKDKLARRAFDELRQLFDYCQLMGIDDRLRFEPTLARGLNYYTGVIFEATVDGRSCAAAAACTGRPTVDC